MKEKLAKIKKYLKSKNKFILQDPVSFEQKFSLTLTKSSTLLVGLALFLIIGTIFYFVISYTSLRNFIPGFPKNASELYEIDKENQEKVILLEQKTASRNKWITNLQSILNNKDTITLLDIDELIKSDSTVDYKNIIFERSQEDSILRKRIANQKLNGSDKLVRNILKNLMNFEQPLPGEMSSTENQGLNESFYKAKYKSQVKSSMEGVVISKTSNSIFIQHPHNVISAYYDLSEIKPTIGSDIYKGDKIGIMRDTALRYQLWYKGKTIPSSIYSDL